VVLSQRGREEIVRRQIGLGTLAQDSKANTNEVFVTEENFSINHVAELVGVRRATIAHFDATGAWLLPSRTPALNGGNTCRISGCLRRLPITVTLAPATHSGPQRAAAGAFLEEVTALC
jgi:hypothetical protein